MTIVRWQPFQEIDTLQRQMNRLFDNLVVTDGDSRPMNSTYFPPVEIEETEEAIHLKLETPGMNAKELDIHVTADAVAIGGERKSEKRTEENGTVRSEFRYGSFRRVIPLPARVQNTQVKADYKDGILNLNLPKAEEEKNKVFKVNLD